MEAKKGDHRVPTMYMTPSVTRFITSPRSIPQSHQHTLLMTQHWQKPLPLWNKSSQRTQQYSNKRVHCFLWRKAQLMARFTSEFCEQMIVCCHQKSLDHVIDLYAEFHKRQILPKSRNKHLDCCRSQNDKWNLKSQSSRASERSAIKLHCSDIIRLIQHSRAETGKRWSSLSYFTTGLTPRAAR